MLSSAKVLDFYANLVLEVVIYKVGCVDCENSGCR